MERTFRTPRRATCIQQSTRTNLRGGLNLVHLHVCGTSTCTLRGRPRRAPTQPPLTFADGSEALLAPERRVRVAVVVGDRHVARGEVEVGQRPGGVEPEHPEAEPGRRRLDLREQV